VSQQNREQTGVAESAATKAEWIRPEVDRLVAGGAESGGSTSTDGIDIFS
jgi:hypothetical protein